MDKVKNLTMFLMLYLISLMVFSQEKQQATKIEYDMQLGFRPYPYYDAKLVFDDKASVFMYRTKQSEDIVGTDSNGNMTIEVPDKSIQVVFNHNDSPFIKQMESRYENIGVSDLKSSLKWEMVNDTTKLIGTYNCKLAYTNYKGREYYAWYTEKIPVSYGPWKLVGLPGLVVQAYDTSGDVKFQLIKMEKTDKSPYDFPVSKTKFYSKKEFDSIVDKELQEKLKKLKSKGSRGFKISVEFNKREEIEK